MFSPWYFSRQTWPRHGCWPKCTGKQDLQYKRKISSINFCHKVIDEKCPTLPPFTTAEIEAGATDGGIQWDCTDGNNPGSVCTKSCKNGHLKLAGSFDKFCACKDKCNWVDSKSSYGRYYL